VQGCGFRGCHLWLDTTHRRGPRQPLERSAVVARAVRGSHQGKGIGQMGSLPAFVATMMGSSQQGYKVRHRIQHPFAPLASRGSGRVHLTGGLRSCPRPLSRNGTRSGRKGSLPQRIDLSVRSQPLSSTPFGTAAGRVDSARPHGKPAVARSPPHAGEQLRNRPPEINPRMRG